MALDLPRVRCASFHQDQHADPIGAGPAYDGFLVIDLALPWDAEVTTQEPLRSIVDGPATAAVAADGSRWRVLARVPAPHHVAAGLRRVTEHRLDRRVSDGLDLRGPFLRREWIIDEADVAALGGALLAGDTDAVPATDSSADGEPDAAGPDVGGAVDLLICTHGRRDGCCGSFGTSLFDRVAGAFARSGTVVDMQRISHTGGHRFAPTAITFPDGYAWAHLDEMLTELLVRRAEPPAFFAGHCRGSALFEGAPAQAADRAGLVEVGWEWADGARTVEVLGFDRSTMATELRATALLADATIRAVDVVVSPDRWIPMPTCGTVDGPEYRTETIWRLDEVRVVGHRPTASPTG